MPNHRPPALLLLGPTGLGKTPLGLLLEARGLAGHRCVHFDFGDNLRQAVARYQPDDILSREDIEFLRHVLEENEGEFLFLFLPPIFLPVVPGGSS